MNKQAFVQKHLLRRSWLSYLLLPLSLPYTLYMLLRRKMAAMFPEYRAPVCIISVGNLIAGGSGKTPFTIYLAKLLAGKGIRVAVSHRGYGSVNERMTQIVSDRTGLLAACNTAGDEVQLLAEELRGIPVVSGKHRKAAIRLLLKQFPDLDCIILDDSFQHLQVRHDVDIIVVNAHMGFGNGFVLPAGYLREPVPALKYADILIINNSQQQMIEKDSLAKGLSAYHKPLLAGHYQVEGCTDFQGQPVTAEQLRGIPILLVSAIGNPAGFARTAHQLGLEIAGQVQFPDHYPYVDKTALNQLLSTMRSSGAQRIVTTAKDYVKLQNHPELASVLVTLHISFVLDKEQEFLTRQIMAVIDKKRAL